MTDLIERLNAVELAKRVLKVDRPEEEGEIVAQLIVADILDRGALGDAWEGIDSETVNEIMTAWFNIIDGALNYKRLSTIAQSLLDLTGENVLLTAEVAAMKAEIAALKDECAHQEGMAQFAGEEEARANHFQARAESAERQRDTARLLLAEARRGIEGLDGWPGVEDATDLKARIDAFLDMKDPTDLSWCAGESARDLGRSK